jgi:hypothetical protein
MKQLRTVWGGLLGCLFAGALLVNPFKDINAQASLNTTAAVSETPIPTLDETSPTPTVITPTMQSLYAPLIAGNIGVAPIELNQVWNGDAKGNRQDAFLSNNEIRFYGLGYSRVPTDTIHLAWDQAGPCGTNQVFSGTVQVNPGEWQTYITSTVPGCIGIYTNTLQFTYKQYTNTLSANFVVNLPSQVIIGAHQGFDRCNVPSLSEMQTWWDKSPYYSINLYIGGILSHCGNQELDALWVQEVAKQGWTYIPTWVGPQAPCSGFREIISYDPNKSYLQGRSEADSAVEASIQLGLLDGSIIYYDVESYAAAYNNQSCRNAMNAFLKGWTERLHALGYRAGAYGASCNSFIAEWATINPTLDDVWIAHWHVPAAYDPDATVWNAPCLDNNLWNNHQRIKQYAGDHVETWGGVSMAIDSDVIDGEVSYLPITGTQQSVSEPVLAAPSTTLTITGPQIKAMQALRNGVGWFLIGDHLLWRDARNLTWQQSALPLQQNESVLDLNFQSNGSGFLVVQNGESGEINVYATVGSRDHWQEISSIQAEGPISQGSLSFVDSQTGWLSLRLPSSSNFNLGRLFHTTDGGHSWAQLPIPTGGEIHFVDNQRGWVEGGASGDELYSTNNGGQSWTRLEGNMPSDQPWIEESGNSNAVSTAHASGFGNLPGTILNIQFSDPLTGWALVRQSACTGEKIPIGVVDTAQKAPFQCTTQQILFETHDGGRTWAKLPL